MSGGHLLCADRSGTKTHCGDGENVAEAARRRRRILQSFGKKQKSRHKILTITTKIHKITI